MLQYVEIFRIAFSCVLVIGVIYYHDDALNSFTVDLVPTGALKINDNKYQ